MYPATVLLPPHPRKHLTKPLPAAFNTKTSNPNDGNILTCTPNNIAYQTIHIFFSFYLS